MRKLYSELIGQPVMSRDAVKPVARVFGLVLDPNNGCLVALSVHPTAQMVVGARDIVSWTPQVIIRDSECVIEPNEVVRIQKVLNQCAPFIRNCVETESGKDLGCVYDYVFDVNAGVVLKIMVSHGFLGLVRWGERIIPMSEIIRVEPKRIIVKDDLLIEPVSSKPTQAMAGV